jgi:hypothetical protein
MPVLLSQGNVPYEVLPKTIGKLMLKFSRVRLLPAGVQLSHSTAISVPYCRTRYVAGPCYSFYANPPFSTRRRQGSGTNGF